MTEQKLQLLQLWLDRHSHQYQSKNTRNLDTYMCHSTAAAADAAAVAAAANAAATSLLLLLLLLPPSPHHLVPIANSPLNCQIHVQAMCTAHE
jgi:hypothetical protein